MTDLKNLHIESSLPKPWEEEQNLSDTLYDWMSRAPWFAISAAAHVLAYFILAAIPWSALNNSDAKEFQSEIAQAPEEIIEEPEEIIEEEIEEEPIEEPVLKDAEAEEVLDDVEVDEGDPDFISDADFDSDAFNNVIGIGGGAGGKFGGRFGKRRSLGKRGGSGTEQALEDALNWLKEHQGSDGSWGCESFSDNCGKIGNDTCGDPGSPSHDVGVTGLALLAFLGSGNTTTQGPYKDVVARGVTWLREEQDYETGLIGDNTSKEYIYDHAIATLAITEAYLFSKSPLIKRPAQEAVNFILQAQTPYQAWRYDVPSIGENDTSVTGWMLFALSSAKSAKLKVDPAALENGMAWIDSVTNMATGLVGYTEKGSSSSRTPANEQYYDREKGETMTAVGLLCRIFMGLPEDAKEKADIEALMNLQADALAAKPPKWEEGGTDMYYWYYGTYAMFQLGGSHWQRWNLSMKDALLKNQVTKGDAKGSWDPIGPWGYSGGRVYSTALMTLCLEVYFRYDKLLGSR